MRSSWVSENFWIFVLKCSHLQHQRLASLSECGDDDDYGTTEDAATGQHPLRLWLVVQRSICSGQSRGVDEGGDLVGVGRVMVVDLPRLGVVRHRRSVVVVIVVDAVAASPRSSTISLREAREHQSFLVVELAQDLVVVQVVTISNTEPATWIHHDLSRDGMTSRGHATWQSTINVLRRIWPYKIHF